MSKAKETLPPEEANEIVSISDDVLLDYITNREVKDTPKERVRQRISRALFHEYGLSVEDMQPDFSIPVELGGKMRNRSAEIAIFQHGQPHDLAHLSRVVVCRPEPKNGKRGVMKLRDHEQAKNDLEDLKAFMTAVPLCRYGLWTDGLDFFFLQKEITRLKYLSNPAPTGLSPTRVRVATQQPLTLGCAEPIRRCYALHFGDATTSSTAMRACRRMLLSGSSCI